MRYRNKTDQTQFIETFKNYYTVYPHEISPHINEREIPDYEKKRISHFFEEAKEIKSAKKTVEKVKLEEKEEV